MKEQQKETSAKMVTLNKFAPKDSQTKTDGMYDPAFEHENCGIGKTHDNHTAIFFVAFRSDKPFFAKTMNGTGCLFGGNIYLCA